MTQRPLSQHPSIPTRRSLHLSPHPTHRFPPPGLCSSWFPPTWTAFLPLLLLKTLLVLQSSAPMPPTSSGTQRWEQPLCSPQPWLVGSHQSCISRPQPLLDPHLPHAAWLHAPPCPGRPQRGHCAAAAPPSAGCGWRRSGRPRARR